MVLPAKQSFYVGQSSENVLSPALQLENVSLRIGCIDDGDRPPVVISLFDEFANLSTTVGKSLAVIFNDMSRLASEIEAISISTQEQAAAMEENTTITEGNASTAEKLASAAEQMSAQAAILSGLVSQFNIAKKAPVPAPPAEPANV